MHRVQEAIIHWIIIVFLVSLAHRCLFSRLFQVELLQTENRELADLIEDGGAHEEFQLPHINRHCLCFSDRVQDEFKGDLLLFL